MVKCSYIFFVCKLFLAFICFFPHAVYDYGVTDSCMIHKNGSVSWYFQKIAYQSTMIMFILNYVPRHEYPLCQSSIKKTRRLMMIVHFSFFVASNFAIDFFFIQFDERLVTKTIRLHNNKSIFRYEKFKLIQILLHLFFFLF